MDDALWKEQNHALLEQAIRYEAAFEQARVARDWPKVTLYYSSLVATLHLHAQEELSRLDEKLRKMSAKERRA
jgi:hypothetical protein